MKDWALPSATYLVVAAANTAAVGVLVAVILKRKRRNEKEKRLRGAEDDPPALLECVRARRSVFARSWLKDRRVSAKSVNRLLEAAMWAPYHGPVPPWRFVVLGPKAIIDLQKVTLSYYDANWASIPKFETEEKYQKWRKKREDAIEGKWSRVSWLIGIVVRRQASSAKRLPMWEEEAATACAVQNMHIQACSHRGLGCYWTSWPAEARESDEMREFLGMGGEDRCMGFFAVAAYDPAKAGDNRRRNPETHLSVDWLE